MRSLLALLTLLVFTGFAAGVDNATAQTEDLGADLLQPDSAEVPSEQSKPAAKPLDRRLQQAAGEDIGMSSAEGDPLLNQVVDAMQDAEEQLASGNSAGAASSAQQHALANLDAMIAQVTEKQSQCSGGQCKKPSDKSADQPGSKGSGSKPRNAPTTSSTTEVETAAGEATGQLINDLWGHLPQRQREEILQPLGEEFLPEYAAEIEAYFRALADPERRD